MKINIKTKYTKIENIQLWSRHLVVYWWYCSGTRDLHDPFFSDLRSDPDPFVKSGSTIRSDPFTLLRKGSTIRYFQILFDPFRSDPYHVYLRIQFHKSCIFWNLTTFLTIARSHKIMILLRNANFSFKKAVCLWKITEWKIYFFIFKKILLSFVQKGSTKKNLILLDPIHDFLINFPYRQNQYIGR